MKLKRRFILIFCMALVFAQCLLPRALAMEDGMAPAIRDMDPESPRYCKVAILACAGLLDLDDDGRFYPNRALSAQTAVNALLAFYAPDETNGMSYDGKVRWLRENDYVTEPERVRLSDGEVNYIMLWRMTQMLLGVYPAPAELHPEIEPQPLCTGVYDDARAAAIQMGLADGTEHSISMLPRGVFADYLYKLYTGAYCLPDCLAPDAAAFFPGSDLIDFNKSTVSRRNVRAWNGYLTGFRNLPEEYVEMFRAGGWRVVFGEDYRQPDGSVRKVKGGLCVYSKKEIWLNRCDERGLYHEFGHFIAYKAGVLGKMSRYYDLEATAARGLLGDYSQTSPDEFFADFISYYLNDSTDNGLLREAAPVTYDLVSGLLDGIGTNAAQAA